MQLEIRFKGVGILLTLGILEHYPLRHPMCKSNYLRSCCYDRNLKWRSCKD